MEQKLTLVRQQLANILTDMHDARLNKKAALMAETERTWDYVIECLEGDANVCRIQIRWYEKNLKIAEEGLGPEDLEGRPNINEAQNQ